MARWMALGITLLLMGSCSFVSTSVFRGMIAPIGAVVFSFISLYLFVHDRVAHTTRPPAAILMDAETQRLLRERAERNKATQEGAVATAPARPESPSGAAS